MSPYVVPDHVLERNIPTPLTPTFWGDLTIVSFDALDYYPQTSAFPDNHVSAQLPASSKESENTSTPLAKSADIPDIRHHRLFFEDGNITFRVQGVLYRVHRYLFCESSDFEDIFARFPTQQETSDPPIIPLEDVKSADFNAFLSILYPQNYNTLEVRSFKEWSSILDLSTRWGFVGIRELAIRCTKPPNSLTRLVLARKHGVEQWILPALLELCQRPEPLSLEEARLMDFEDVVLVGSVRQTVRSATLMVRGPEIRNCIRAWKRGEPWSQSSDSDLIHPQDDICQEPICYEEGDNLEPVPVWGGFGGHPEPVPAWGGLGGHPEPVPAWGGGLGGHPPEPVPDSGAGYKSKKKKGIKGR